MATLTTGDDLSQLVHQHQKQLIGWFRARLGARSDAEDLAQRTWIEVLGRADTFDPERGSFWTFTKIWAGFVLRRYWAEASGDSLLIDGDLGEGDLDIDCVGGDALGSTAPLTAFNIVSAVLRCALGCRRLPHEVAVFGFVKLLQWKPSRVVEELSAHTVEYAVDCLEAEYLKDVPHPDVRSAFEALRVKLKQPLRACGVDRRTLQRYAPLQDRPTGTILLNDLYGGDDREAAVTRWWAAVARVVEEDLLRTEDGPLGEWLSEQPVVRLRRAAK